MLGVSPPAWEPHPDVWLLVALLGGSYAVALVRLGPRFAVPGKPPASRLQIVSFALGVLALLVGADWPIHDIGERYNFSIHMVQHLVFSMVAAPLLLLGTPAWLLRWILHPPSVRFRWVRALSRFFPAIILFNAVLVVTHWPLLVNTALDHALVHFLVHALVFLSAFIIWMPVLSPLPEIPRLAPPWRIAFLFLQSIVPTLPASFLTFGSTPLYRYYEDVPHLWGMSTLDDQQVAGLIMKIGAGLLLWMIIAVIFFRWAGEEDRRRIARRRWQDLDRQLSGMGTRST
jgi:putative membrane protein